MLGYHVHEKAVLMVSVPLGVLAAAGRLPGGRAALGDFLFLSTGAPPRCRRRRNGERGTRSAGRAC